MKSQMNFMQSFVDDLLDLKTMREGAFKLTISPFNPNKVIEYVYSIF